MLVLAVAFSLFYQAVNGFHDTANAVATVVYTRSLRANPAVVLSGVCNFGIPASSSHTLIGAVLGVGLTHGWVKVSVALALGIGTMIGWKRVAVTVGEKIGNKP